MQRKLTKLQAYNAIVTFIDRYYLKNKSDNLSDFITYAFFWFDGKTADPAAWPEWQDVLKATAKQDKTVRDLNRLTRLQALDAMINFFKFYCSLYGKIPFDMIAVLKMLEDLQNNKNKDAMWLEWMSSIDEVIAKKDPRFYIQAKSEEN